VPIAAKSQPQPEKQKAPHTARVRGLLNLAEGVGFEPTDGLPSPVFKTGAFSRSATPPCVRGAVATTAAARSLREFRLKAKSVMHRWESICICLPKPYPLKANLEPTSYDESALIEANLAPYLESN
jgi:hypothetical protein